MNKYFLKTFIIFFILNITTAFGSENIKTWFETSIKKFFDIVDEQDVKIRNNNLKSFVNNNFDTISLSYSLLPETIFSKLTKKEKDDYKTAFDNYFLNAIYDFVEKYNKPKIKIEEIKNLNGNFADIYSIVSLNDGEYQIIWRTILNSDNKHKIIDVIVENISFYNTKKTEFNNILRKNKGDISKLIGFLTS